MMRRRISARFTRDVPISRKRQALLENLIEEDRGPENHLELWFRLPKVSVWLAKPCLRARPRPRRSRSLRFLELTTARQSSRASQRYTLAHRRFPKAQRRGRRPQTIYGIHDERAH